MKLAKQLRRRFKRIASQREIREFMSSVRKIQVCRTDVCQVAPTLYTFKDYGSHNHT